MPNKRKSGIPLLLTGWLSLSYGFAEAPDVPPEPAGKPEERQISFRDLDSSSRLVIAAQIANQFSVMIKSTTCGLFDPECKVEGGVGTGAIIEINEAEDYFDIVTNRHVVKSDPLEAQKLSVSLTVPGSLDEEISAKAIYVEPRGGDDVAFIRCRLSDVKRAKVIKAPVPSMERLATMYQTGVPVMSHGNPSVERNSVTAGVLSQEPGPNFGGRWYFKTDAPINPGNSGGPLLRIGYHGALDENADAPWMIGVNTIKRVNADSMGYAIPTFVWLPKYQWLQKGGLRKSKGYLYLQARPVTTKIPLEDNLKDVIEAEFQSKLGKSFFEVHRAVIMVENAQKNSGLKAGDYILAVGNKILGPDEGALFEAIAQAKKKLELTILRDRKIFKVKVPITNTRLYEEKKKNEFVMLSGMFIQDMLPNEKAEMANQSSGVLVNQILWDGMAAHLRDRGGLVQEGALIYELEIAGKKYPVKDLNALKAALKNASLDDFIWVRLRNAFVALDEWGEPVRSTQNETTSLYLQVHEVMTDADFSLQALRERVQLDSIIPGRRQWRQLTGMDCRRSLQDLTRHLKPIEADFEI